MPFIKQMGGGAIVIFWPKWTATIIDKSRNTTRKQSHFNFSVITLCHLYETPRDIASGQIWWDDKRNMQTYAEKNTRRTIGVSCGRLNFELIFCLLVLFRPTSNPQMSRMVFIGLRSRFLSLYYCLAKSVSKVSVYKNMFHINITSPKNVVPRSCLNDLIPYLKRWVFQIMLPYWKETFKPKQKIILNIIVREMNYDSGFLR